MQTGDGLLVRLTPARAGLPSAIVRELAKLAERHGNGLLEVSTRGNWQIRGLTSESTAALSSEIEGVLDQFRFGLTLDANPFTAAGSDSARLVAAIEEMSEHPNLKQRLAPKFSIVVDDGGCIDLAGVIADIRLRWAASDRWAIVLGDNEESGRLLGYVRPADGCAAVSALAEAIAEIGPNARGRDLSLPRAQIATTAAASSFESGADPIPERAMTIHVGHIRLQDESLAVLSPAYGMMHASSLNAIIDAIDEIAGARQIRLCTTAGRLISVRGLDDHHIERLLTHEAARDFITKDDDPRLSIAACAGHPACDCAHFDTHAAADRLVERGLLPHDGSTVHLSGCEKECARPAHAAVHLIGRPNGIDAFDDHGSSLGHFTEPEDAVVSTLPSAGGIA
ncbi:hypothetical protein [Notoacmeibacter ruber]|nr:hypothetical protein [Notoacmeibacter ruber]